MENETIELKDKNGVVRIRIGVSEDDVPGITLFDANAKERLSLKLQRLSSKVDDAGSPSIYFFGKDGEMAIRLCHRPFKINDTEYNISDIEIRDPHRERVRMSLTTGITDPEYSQGAIGVYQKNSLPYAGVGYHEVDGHSGSGCSIYCTERGTAGIQVIATETSTDIQLCNQTHISYIKDSNDFSNDEKTDENKKPENPKE
ncbi:MAG: hypothetical protein Q4G68_00035 [Planctomycetia bacterium]|nr:hypothetical protein [Planctomycetia bacterium]